MVAGKGGVGKTTVTAVIARAASDAGLRVLVVELDGKPALAQLVPDLEVMPISAPEALDEYLRDNGFARIAKRLNRTGVIDMVGTAAPGIDDIVVLGKIKQLERAGQWDLVVVDGPAAGHTITFLTSAAGLADSVRSGPVRSQADDVLELLHDPQRCQVVLVTLAETTPVNEVIETAYALEDQVGVQLGPVIVNGVDLGVELPAAAATSAIVGDLDAATAATLTDAADFRRFAPGNGTTGARPSRRAVADPADRASGPARGRPGRARRHRARRRARRSGSLGDSAMTTRPADELIDASSVIVCCGSGGVGKTTTAAVLGLEAARRGRRAVVVTIDPARRLADALGLVDGLASEPQRIELDAPGELWAMMLDTAATFDGLVRRYAENPEQVERILENGFYRNIAGALSGTQEYMAAETLHALHGDERFDLVVVDTPPSRNALDFLEAPGVLSGSSTIGSSSC